MLAELQGNAFFEELPVQLRGEIVEELVHNILKDGHVFCDLVSFLIDLSQGKSMPHLLQSCLCWWSVHAFDIGRDGCLRQQRYPGSQASHDIMGQTERQGDVNHSS